MTESIIDKIAKLLNLAKGKGTTPAESAAAATQAQKLMLKYQISEAEVSASGNKPAEEIKCNTEFWKGGKIISWKMSLISGIAQCNSCRCLIQSIQGSSSIWMIGTTSNMQICNYLFLYLSKEIERLADEATPGYSESTRRFKNSFRHGATQEVLKRLNDVKKETRQEAVNEGKASTALVRLDQHEAEVELFKDKMSGKGKYTSGNPTSYSGYHAGKLAGSKIPLNKGVDGKEIKRLS